jgi:hypothetical protein
MNKVTRLSLNDIINDFDQEIIQNPDYPDAYCARGMLKYCLRDINGAFSDWSVAAAMGCRQTIALIHHLTLS